MPVSKTQMIIVDPGTAGGIVIEHGTGVVTATPMPATKGDILNVLTPPFAIAGGPPEDAYLEELVKYTGRNMPSSSMSVYASNHGFIEGVLMTFGYRLVIVPPKKWQKALGLGSAQSHSSRTAWKNHLKNRAQQLFPKLKVTLATSDALLMYEAARQGLLR